jgi:hypothetical protein
MAVLVEFDVLNATPEQMYELEERTGSAARLSDGHRSSDACSSPSHRVVPPSTSSQPGALRRLSGQHWTPCWTLTSRPSVRASAMSSSVWS